MVYSILNRRESLIITALDVIDELGIQGLSTREVARRLGMSNAAIFNHFSSKQELILAVLDHYTQYDLAVEQAINLHGLKSVDAIVYYFEIFNTYYENYPAITAIKMSYNDLRCEPYLAEKINKILYSRNNYIKTLVEDAQRENQIRSDIESTYLSDILLGTSREICLKWRMEGFGFSLKERVVNTIKLILDNFAP